jgi:hypothetical protein
LTSANRPDIDGLRPDNESAIWSPAPEREHGAEPPTPDPQPTPADQRPKPRRRAELAVAFAVGALASSFLTNLGQDVYRNTVGPWFESKKPAKPASLENQLNRIVADAGRRGYRLVGSVQLVSFRPAGDLSRMMLFRPLDPSAQKSDDLRIYDIHDGRLKLAFEFRPAVKGPKAGRTPTLSSRSQGDQLVFPVPKAFTIRVRLIRDLNAASGDEALLDVSESAFKPVWPRPFYLYWDSAAQRFRVTPLLSPATTGRSTMARVLTTQYLRSIDSYAAAVRRIVYLEPLAVTGATNTLPMQAFAVEAYIVRGERVQTPQGKLAAGLILNAGYIVRDAGYAMADRLQVVTWHVNLLSYPITARTSLASPFVVQVGTATGHLNEVLAEHH